MSNEEFEKFVEQFCDGYCKFPYICKTQEQLETACDNCPITKIAELKEKEVAE